MNHHIPVEASLGLAIGFLVVTWAAFRSSDAPKPGAMSRGGMVAVLVYAVLAVPVFATSGLTLLGLVVLLVVIALAFAANTLSRDRAVQDSPGTLERFTRTAVSIGIAAVLLVSAAQTISLVGRLDPRIVVVTVAAVAAYLVFAQGLAATHRIGSTTMWFMIVPVVVALFLGLFLGGADVLVPPLRPVAGISAASAVGIALALIAIGWADNTLRGSARVGSWSPVRTLLGPLVVVALIVVGLLMFLGGGVLVPSLEFFTVPANLDKVPGVAGAALLFLTVLFTGLTAHALSGTATGEPDSQLSKTTTTTLWAAIIAAVLALVGLGAPMLLLLTSLVAAALLGAQAAGRHADRGLAVGLVVALFALTALLVTGETTVGWWTGLAVLVTAVAAWAAAATGTDESRAVPAA